MADVIHVPSIWDYIAQAGSQGVQSFTDAKKYTQEEADRQAGLATQLFQQGAIGSQDLAKNPVIAKITPNIQPNKPELMRNIAASPKVNPVTGQAWNDAERMQAGMPSQAQEAAQQTAAQVDAIKQRYMQGGHLTDAEARAIGVPTGDDEIAATDKVLQQVGPKYADSALAPLVQANGGMIPYRGWDQAVDNATAAYNSDRQAKGLPPDPSARNFFASQILDRIRQQKLLEIEKLKAEGMFAARPTPQDRMFDTLTGVINSRITEMDALSKGDPTLMMKMTNPKYSNDPNVIRYKMLDRNIRKAQNAQAKLAGGLSGDLQVGLAQDDTNNLTPTGSTQGTPSGIDQNKANTAIQRLQSGKATLQQLEASPVFSPAEKDYIKTQYLRNKK
jgi:hypothetical protein